MNRKWAAHILAAMIGLLQLSCDEIVEDSLESQQVAVISPADSVHLSSNYLEIVWNALDEATAYRIEVAKPNFAAITQLVFDSTTTEDRITVALEPGEYAWRIRGENGTSTGAWLTRTVYIDSTSNLSNQAIVLQYPAQNAFTNAVDVSFGWYELYSATSYSFLLKYDDWAGEWAVPEINGDANSVNVSDLEEGVYAWGVRGEAMLSNTPYVYRTITIDRTAPVVPSLVAPANNAVMNADITLKWLSPVEVSPVHDSIRVYANAALTNLIYTAGTAADSIAITLSTGQYYWQVQSWDAAGNSSEWSDSQSFIVQ